MRRIYISELYITDEWEEEAAQALEAIQDLDPDQRKDAIDKLSSVWAKLKEQLASLSDNKCWYCESRQDRSDNAVDHYRPKKRVDRYPGIDGFQVNSREGYWWLAFDWKNYRYSCTFCNSRRKDVVTDSAGGKGNYFPLINEIERMLLPEEKARLKLERPYLLDPTSSEDCMLLWFETDGRAVPRYQEHPARSKRAEISIDLYHLDHSVLKRKRRNLHFEIEHLIDQGNTFYDGYLNNDPMAVAGFNEVRRQLGEKVAPHAECTSAAKIYLSAHLDIKWVKDIFCTC